MSSTPASPSGPDPDPTDDSAPDPTPGSTSTPEPALSPGAVQVMAMATVLCPLLMAVALRFLDFSTLLSADSTNPVLILHISAIATALIGVMHLLVLLLLRHLGVPRPWEFSTILSTAFVLGFVQLQTARFLPPLVSQPFPAPCLLPSLFGALGWALTRHRRGLRLPLALVLVVATALGLVGLSWRAAEHAREQRREELLSDVAGHPLPIVVLDSPGWEPSSMRLDVDPPEVSIGYVLVDPSPELDGAGLALHSEVLREEMRWTLREECDPRGGTWDCVERGNAVIATDRGGYGAQAQVRMEVAHGIIARLTVYLPDDYYEENPNTAFPEIDLAELSEHIRLAEPGKAEEIAVAVTD
ncbi:hypothetical protein [Nocardiopsis halotolerans]|uniref:hypothetical protein n=1 Tax=Nocardiopsis halotolerans TaxID=124252 RepID=UPI0003481630|nr:hypothetical protein [Nocardiopsis halotolerans]